MRHEQNQRLMLELKLKGMLAFSEAFHRNPAFSEQSFYDSLGQHLQAESDQRNQNRLDRMMKEARLAHTDACVEGVNFSVDRKLDRQRWLSLASLEWVHRQQHVALIGKTGCGKSWLGCALGFEGIRKKVPCLFYRYSRLLEDFRIARGDGSLPKLRKRLERFTVLILDDFGSCALDANGRQDIMELVEDRTGRASLIITSQLPVESWHEYIGDPTLSDAILDRILSRTHVLNIDGPSLRPMYADMEDTRHDH